MKKWNWNSACDVGIGLMALPRYNEICFNIRIHILLQARYKSEADWLINLECSSLDSYKYSFNTFKRKLLDSLWPTKPKESGAHTTAF